MAQDFCVLCAYHGGAFGTLQLYGLLRISLIVRYAFCSLFACGQLSSACLLLITITLRLCTCADPLLNFLLSTLRKLLLMSWRLALLRGSGWSTTRSHGVWDLGKDKLHGQRALRLWLELIALLEHFHCCFVLATLTTHFVGW
jgi:hypothetical protein